MLQIFFNNQEKLLINYKFLEAKEKHMKYELQVHKLIAGECDEKQVEQLFPYIKELEACCFDLK